MALHFNMEVDTIFLVGLIIEEFRWMFCHSDCVYVRFEVGSTLGCVGCQVMN